MVCGKCKWWTGLLVYGTCLFPRSRKHEEETIYLQVCTVKFNSSEAEVDVKTTTGESL